MLPLVTLVYILTRKNVANGYMDVYRNHVKVKRYHHGDLKNELLKKSHKLLKTKGLNGFSLRELAANAGVSHAALYRHFQSKEEIIDALAETGFLRLASLQKKVKKDPTNPNGYFVSLGNIYIQFAIKNPEYYRIMFQMKRNAEPDSLIKAKTKSYAVLVHGCRFYLKSKNRKDNHRIFALMAWSLVHGYSDLCLATEFPKVESKTFGKTMLNLAEDILKLSISSN